jgi:hypothetical protein
MEKVLKDKLEKETLQKSIKLVIDREAGIIDDSTAVRMCIEIIRESTQEFQEKMGRAMTYSEMEELFGNSLQQIQ